MIPVDYELGKEIVETCTCECGAGLTLPWGGRWGALKWSDQTMLSFLAGEPYKVSGKSVTEALGKLTREKAESFVEDINGRIKKQQPELFS